MDFSAGISGGCSNSNAVIREVHEKKEKVEEQEKREGNKELRKSKPSRPWPFEMLLPKLLPTFPYFLFLSTSCSSPCSVSLVALGMGTSALLVALALWRLIAGLSIYFYLFA